MPGARIALLRTLADGNVRSASQLALGAACSPLEIRQRIALLRDLGAEIKTVHGRGYRMVAPFAALESKKIAARLDPSVDLQLLDETDSTNGVLLREAADRSMCPKSGRACIAELQTGGRGRRGRTWFSVPGASLAFSMLWRFERPLEFLAGLSLAAGVSVVRVMHRIGAEEVRLKWPNDVVNRHRKLAGILVETQGANSGPSIAVVGVGINLRLPTAVRERIDQAVTDVAAAVPELPERNEFAALLLNELAVVLDEFALNGFTALREEWAALHSYQGQAVRMHCGSTEAVTGRVTGVAPDGALLVATSSGEQRFYSGEISLRAA